ncbi:phosphoglycerate mutase family protein [Pendulispora rubella]|uniref:Phosphoglycerate mutase family protein n=1 Tax=Pendulispora rubella TaxID=2741070 RepID=A0ABZ2LN29_9BACT
MGTVLLVRHGQASFGSDDYDCLSELGIEQSRLLGDWLSACGRTIDRAVVGGMKRHRQTAEACLSAMGLGACPLEIDAGFEEYDADEVVIRHRPEFADRQVLARLLAEHDNPRRAFQSIFSAAIDRWVGGEWDADYREPWSTFRTRCVAALRRLTDDPGPSRTVAVFTSGGPITAICQHLLGIPDRSIFELNWSIVNSSMTALRFSSRSSSEHPGRVTLSSFNVVAHLERMQNVRLITYR